MNEHCHTKQIQILMEGNLTRGSQPLQVVLRQGHQHVLCADGLESGTASGICGEEGGGSCQIERASHDIAGGEVCRGGVADVRERAIGNEVFSSG